VADWSVCVSVLRQKGGWLLSLCMSVIHQKGG